MFLPSEVIRQQRFGGAIRLVEKNDFEMIWAAIRSFVVIGRKKGNNAGAQS